MGLKLPTWQELSMDEQIPIINLPLNHNYVVIGGPGTGKTAMALYRAAKWKHTIEESDIQKSEQNILFLVFNKPLSKYLKDALEVMDLSDGNAKTWHSWFYNFYRTLTKESVPEIDPYKPDWDAVRQRIEKIPDHKFIHHLIIDEAQDFPEELLRILNKFSDKATIFGDQNQAIINKTTTAHFTNAFNANQRVFSLNRNYRNTFEIASVANLFYTGNQDDIPAASKKTGPKPVFYNCSSYNKIIEIISNYTDNNPSEMIGVLIPGKDQNLSTIIKKYARDIEASTNAKVQCYVNNRQSNPFDFQLDGVKVLSYGTAKGLEFDTVFLPEINIPILDKSDDFITRNSIYVAASRAKNNLFFLGLQEQPDNFVVRLLRQNKDMLTWREVK